jgi:hypothetical protein
MTFGIRHLHEKFGKPVLFTEVGYCSTFNGTYLSTTLCTGSTPVPDLAMQALRYEARGWWMGVRVFASVTGVTGVRAWRNVEMCGGAGSLVDMWFLFARLLLLLLLLLPLLLLRCVQSSVRR